MIKLPELSYGHDLCHFLDKFLHLGIHLVIFAIYGKFFFFPLF